MFSSKTTMVSFWPLLLLVLKWGGGDFVASQTPVLNRVSYSTIFNHTTWKTAIGVTASQKLRQEENIYHKKHSVSHHGIFDTNLLSLYVYIFLNSFLFSQEQGTVIFIYEHLFYFWKLSLILNVFFNQWFNVKPLVEKYM